MPEYMTPSGPVSAAKPQPGWQEIKPGQGYSSKYGYEVSPSGKVSYPQTAPPQFNKGITYEFGQAPLGPFGMDRGVWQSQWEAQQRQAKWQAEQQRAQAERNSQGQFTQQVTPPPMQAQKVTVSPPPSIRVPDRTPPRGSNEITLAYTTSQRISSGQAKEAFSKADPFTQAAAYGATLLSPKGYDLIGSTIISAGETVSGKPNIYRRTPEKIVQEALAEELEDRKEDAAAGRDLTTSSFVRGMSKGLQSPIVELELAAIGGAGLTRVAATGAGARVLGSTAGKVGMTGLGAAALGSRGYDIGTSALKGDYERALGLGVTTAGSIGAFKMGAGAEKAYIIRGTRAAAIGVGTYETKGDIGKSDIVFGAKVKSPAGTRKFVGRAVSFYEQPKAEGLPSKGISIAGVKPSGGGKVVYSAQKNIAWSKQQDEFVKSLIAGMSKTSGKTDSAFIGGVVSKQQDAGIVTSFGKFLSRPAGTTKGGIRSDIFVGLKPAPTVQPGFRYYGTGTTTTTAAAASQDAISAALGKAVTPPSVPPLAVRMPPLAVRMPSFAAPTKTERIISAPTRTIATRQDTAPVSRTGRISFIGQETGLASISLTDMGTATATRQRMGIVSGFDVATKQSQRQRSEITQAQNQVQKQIQQQQQRQAQKQRQTMKQAQQQMQRGLFVTPAIRMPFVPPARLGIGLPTPRFKLPSFGGKDRPRKPTYRYTPSVSGILRFEWSGGRFFRKRKPGKGEFYGTELRAPVFNLPKIGKRRSA